MADHQPLAIQYFKKWYEWHNEDAWRVNDTHSIYTIADGVSRKLYLDLKPPLGPKAVAEIMCQQLDAALAQHYQRLSKKTFVQAYTTANQAIAIHNQKQGERDAAVGAAVVVKNGRLYGSRVTDCGFVVLRQGEIFFKTPEFWSQQSLRRTLGYGRLDGLCPIADYVDFYHFKVKTNDRLVLYTDGFEPHWSQSEFVGALAGLDLTVLEPALRTLDNVWRQAEPEKYDQERTLLLVNLDF